MTVAAACAPPGGGRNPVTPRFIRHFSMLCLPTPSEHSLKQIFKVCYIDEQNYYTINTHTHTGITDRYNLLNTHTFSGCTSVAQCLDNMHVCVGYFYQVYSVCAL